MGQPCEVAPEGTSPLHSMQVATWRMQRKHGGTEQLSPLGGTEQLSPLEAASRNAHNGQQHWPSGVQQRRTAHFPQAIQTGSSGIKPAAAASNKQQQHQTSSCSIKHAAAASNQQLQGLT